MPTDAQTDFSVRLKPAAGRQEAEARRPQGICGREDYAAVVDAVVVGAFGGFRACCRARVNAWWAAECEVPFEEIVIERCGGVVGAWAIGEFRCFAD
jgi:hypothetical protein